MRVVWLSVKRNQDGRIMNNYYLALSGLRMFSITTGNNRRLEGVRVVGCRRSVGCGAMSSKHAKTTLLRDQYANAIVRCFRPWYANVAGGYTCRSACDVNYVIVGLLGRRTVGLLLILS